MSLTAVFDRTFPHLVNHLYNSKALDLTACPLKIVGRGPGEVAAYVHAILHDHKVVTGSAGRLHPLVRPLPQRPALKNYPRSLF